MKKSEVNSYRDYRESLLQREKSSVTVRPEAPLSIALVFPNSYAVGMSNLGFQALYRLLNELPDVRCERAFYETRLPRFTRTLESGQELRHFDVVAFSVSFELDFPHVVEMLLSAGIEPFAEKRHAREPMVIAGGAICFINPAPVEPFFDFMFIGEIEPQLVQLMERLQHHRAERTDRQDFLASLVDIPGVHSTFFDRPGQDLQKPAYKFESQLPQYSAVIGPDIHFRDMFLVEVGRGCGRLCHFCAASHVYFPLRIFPIEVILDTVETHGQGAQRVGLIGSALSDYPRLYELCSELVNRGYELGLSSFRLDKITEDFMAVLDRGLVKSLSFAPEAGTEGMRTRINKKLSDEQIYHAASIIAGSNMSHIKLYFMIGLPGETMDDIVGIADMVARIHRMKSKKQTMSVSVNTFIPKPFTPFQWSKMERPKEIQKKRKHLKSVFTKLPGVLFPEKSIKDEILQGVFSLGDQKVAQAIYLKINQNVDWDTAWRMAEIDVEHLLYQNRDADAKLPWEFIQQGLKKERLIQTWKKEM
ncbi:MAG: radical SAM protein [Candidatus Zhuqueibacterota bacterium]